MYCYAKRPAFIYSQAFVLLVDPADGVFCGEIFPLLLALSSLTLFKLLLSDLFADGARIDLTEVDLLGGGPPISEVAVGGREVLAGFGSGFTDFADSGFLTDLAVPFRFLTPSLWK